MIVNPETLQIEAGDKVAEFRRTHNESGILVWVNGRMLVVPRSYLAPPMKEVYTFTRFAMQHGLTSAQWHTVGNKLYNLYQKDPKCQQPPKP